MSYPINYPTPQGANVQIFNANKTTAANGNSFIWVKPQGASMVWITLIGAGGGGGGSEGLSNWGGGGSGAVTNLMIPAFLIPDNLKIRVGQGGAGGALGGNAGDAGGDTNIGSFVESQFLLSAGGGNGGTSGAGGTGGLAGGATPFTATGFFQSVNGANGGVNASLSASSTTFLSGGTSGVGNSVSSNYGYLARDVNNSNGAAGFFQTQPIIFGVGGVASSFTVATNAIGGIGCGGGGALSTSNPGTGARGGNGLVVIITW